MQRKEKLRLDETFINEVFNSSKEIFLAFMDGDFPYCLPFNFAKKEKHIYIHSALRGHKLECLIRNPNVAFSLACAVKIDTAKSTTWFKSLSGRGKGKIIEDFNEKREALDLIARRYNAHCQIPANENMVNRVNIIRVDIVEVTGKNSAPAT